MTSEPPVWGTPDSGHQPPGGPKKPKGKKKRQQFEPGSPEALQQQYEQQRAGQPQQYPPPYQGGPPGSMQPPASSDLSQFGQRRRKRTKRGWIPVAVIAGFVILSSNGALRQFTGNSILPVPVPGLSQPEFDVDDSQMCDLLSSDAVEEVFGGDADHEDEAIGETRCAWEIEDSPFLGNQYSGIGRVYTSYTQVSSDFYVDDMKKKIRLGDATEVEDVGEMASWDSGVKELKVIDDGFQYRVQVLGGEQPQVERQARAVRIAEAIIAERERTGLPTIED